MFPSFELVLPDHSLRLLLVVLSDVGYPLCEFDVEFGESASFVVGRQSDLDFVVDVTPLGMMLFPRTCIS